MSVIQGKKEEAGVRRRMPASDRRVLILEAARAAFAEGGYHRTSLEEIAEHAGVSKALLYEHFDSKRELHAAMLETHVTELLGRINAALADAEPGEARLRAGTEAFFSFLEERRGAAAIMLRNSGDPDVAEWLARLRAQVAAEIVAVMTAEVAELVAKDPEMSVGIEMIAQQQIGAIQSLADWWGEHRDIPRQRLVEAVMDLVWVGMERVSAGERWRPPPVD
jgi:AcrR family transcriptional regulator